MYRILMDGMDIYGPNAEMAVLSPHLDIELNSAGSLEFTLPVDNVSWTTPNVFTNEVEVIEDGEVIFFGRPLQITRDWNNQKKVVCEGALAYFNDTIQRTNEIKISSHITLEAFFRHLITVHNSQVDDQEGSGISHKHFEVGVVDIENKGKYVYRKTDYETTFDCLQQMCLDTDGGYFIIRKEYDAYGNATRYIDWVSEMPYGADQPVQFGVNLLDLSQDLNGADICTVLIPTGEDNINLSGYKTVNPDAASNIYKGVGHLQPSDEIYYKPAIEVYGRVVQQKSWSDYSNQDTLWEKAAEWLKRKNEYIPTIEVSAADLHYIDKYKDHGTPMYSVFKLGMAVEVISAPHGINGTVQNPWDEEPTVLIISRLSLDLDTATKKITIGTPPKKELTDILAPSAGGSSTRGSGGNGSGESSVVHTEEKLLPVKSIKVKYPGDTEFSSIVTNKVASLDLSGMTGNVADVVTSNGTSVVDPNTKIATLPDPPEPPVTDVQVDNVSILDAQGVANLDSSAFGDDVKANPIGTVQGPITKISINDVIYEIQGNGDVVDVKLKTSQLLTLRIITTSTIYSSASVMVETYIDNDLVSQVEYTKTDASTPININNSLELWYDNQWHYELLRDSTTHEEEYTQNWAYNFSVDYSETFSSDFESVVDQNGVAKIDLSSMNVYGIFENKIKHDISAPSVRFGTDTDVFMEEANGKSSTYITLLDDDAIPDNLEQASSRYSSVSYLVQSESGERPAYTYYYEDHGYVDPAASWSYYANYGTGGGGTLQTGLLPADGHGSRRDGEWSNEDVIRGYAGTKYVYNTTSSGVEFTKHFDTKIKPTSLYGTFCFMFRRCTDNYMVAQPNQMEMVALVGTISVLVSDDGTTWTEVFHVANNAEVTWEVDGSNNFDIFCNGFYSYVKVLFDCGSIVHSGGKNLGYMNFELKGIEEGNYIKKIWYKSGNKEWITQPVVLEDELDTAVSTLQSNFQDGVDSIYNACVSKGSTPASHSLTDVVNGILAIPTGGGGGGVNITTSAYEINLPIQYATSNINATVTITTTAGGT